MNLIFYRPLVGYIAALLSGLTLGLSAIYEIPLFTWIAFIPLMIVMDNSSYARRAILICITGTSFGALVIFWVIESAMRYTGENSLLPYFSYIFFILRTILWFMAGFLLFYWIRGMLRDKKEHPIILAVILGLIWFLLEWIQTVLWISFPVLYLGSYLAANPYYVQLAPVMGALGLSALVMVFSYLMARAVISGKWKNYIIPGMVFGLNIAYGFAWIHLVYPAYFPQPKGIKVSLMNENVSAETRWTESGNQIVNTLFQLAGEAVKYNPDIMVWTETAIPWTITEDDDFIYELLKITYPSGTGHLLGIYSENPDDTTKLYNSVYYIHPDGLISGRYDKVYLLDFLEKPALKGILNAAVPFFSADRFNRLQPADNPGLVSTPYGKARIMICNESFSPLLPSYLKGKPFNYIVITSNDAWFHNSYFLRQHFLYSKIQAVQYRKDLVVNSNTGISAIVDAAGKIQAIGAGDSAFILNGKIYPNKRLTFYSRFPNFFPVFSILFILASILYFKLIVARKPKR